MRCATHCEKCSNRITEIVNDFPGVVDLNKGIVTVSYEQIKKRIERVGYSVTKIES